MISFWIISLWCCLVPKDAGGSSENMTVEVSQSSVPQSIRGVCVHAQHACLGNNECGLLWEPFWHTRPSFLQHTRHVFLKDCWLVCAFVQTHNLWNCTKRPFGFEGSSNKNFRPNFLITVNFDVSGPVNGSQAQQAQLRIQKEIQKFEKGTQKASPFVMLSFNSNYKMG